MANAAPHADQIAAFCHGRPAPAARVAASAGAASSELPRVARTNTGERCDENRGVDHEDCVCARGVAQDAGRGWTCEGRQGNERAGQAHRLPAPVAWRAVADDGECAGSEDGGAQAVDGSGGHELSRSLDQRVAQHGRGGDGHARDHRAASAQPVEQRACAQVAEQVGERVGGYGDAGDRGGRAERLGVGRDGGELHEQVEEYGEHHEPRRPRDAPCPDCGVSCACLHCNLCVRVRPVGVPVRLGVKLRKMCRTL